MRSPGLGFLVALLVILLSSQMAFAIQSDHALNGEVIDQESEEPLVGATVEILELERRTVTDADGQFMLERIPEGSYSLVVRFLGYQPIEHEVVLPGADEAPITIALARDVLAVPDVIVTASPTGRATTYQPAQAYALEALQERSASSFGEMLDGEPGIAMRSFGPAPARPVIRGFDGDRVLVLENGERMGDLSETAHDHNIVLDPLAANRVEVVRGPASLLYGSSAIGGVVNLITEDIPHDWSREHSGSLALYGGSVNSSLAGLGRYTYGEERWAATGRLSYRDAADLRTPQGTLRGTSIRNVEGSGGLGYQTDMFSGGLAVMVLDHGFGLPEDIDNADEQVDINLNRQALQGRARWNASGFLQNIELRLHAARLFQQEIESEFRPDGLVDQDIELEFLQYSGNATLTLQHRPLGFLDEGVFGMNVHARDMSVGGEEAFSPSVRNASAAVFTFQEMPVSSTANLQFGIRLERQGLRALPNADFPNEQRSRNSSTFSGSIGLNVRPGHGLEIGAQLARSHRFPMLEELYADGIHFGAGVYERGNPDLQDEVGLGSDLFVRWQTHRLRVELATFYNRIKNYIAFQPTGDVVLDGEDRGWAVYQYEAHNAAIAGAEAALTVQLTEALQTTAAMDYVRGSRIGADNVPLPRMPPLRTLLSLRYDPEPWWGGATLRVVDAQERVAPQEDATDGYVLVDLQAGYRLDRAGRHSLIVRLDNATNTLYRDHLSRVDRTELGAPMPGRNLNVMYRWTF